MFSRAVWLAFLMVANAQNSAVITNCDTTSIFQVQSLDIQPSVPVAGENITMSITYDAPVEVTDGIARYSCILNGLPYSSSNSLCSQTICPIPIGQHVEQSSSDYSGLTGKLVCTIEWLDMDESTYLCVKSTIKLSGALRGSVVSYNMSAPSFYRNYSEPLSYNYDLGLALALAHIKN